MDPCPFVRIVIANLALRKSDHTTPDPSSSSSFCCKFNLKGFPNQASDVASLTHENDVVESKIHGCFALRRTQMERLGERSSRFSKLRILIYRKNSARKNGCGLSRKGKFIGCVDVQLDFKSILESNRGLVIQNGWVVIGGALDPIKLHLNVRAEPDPRFVFQFDGDPECSPQVFQVNGTVKQPVFTCKFGFRNGGGERILRSRSVQSEPSASSGKCFRSAAGDDGGGEQAIKERKGWSITIHDLSGSPVAAASMVTPFVALSGTDKVSKSNPGAWLILRPDQQGTWKPWGRLQAWRERGRLGHRFDLIPDGGAEAIPLANSSISVKYGGDFVIDITGGPTPMTSPNSSFDFSSGSGSGSDPGSASGSGSWGQLLYRGFVMSSTVVGGDSKCSRPEVEVGVQHVSCTEDAAAFVALAAAVDLSMDACRSFSHKLRKELRQSDPV
ncbi:uncharacterized protein LOC127257048 [Andrographis paniculata]|uniref:uncharacterized protein LOC127257048 n=1 Tax=Andrographis paniculata TaxID=175694 RepID=UPI0021E7407E|nr:uncharacterized protein LOC127257048 [Andrographis paniculata]